MFADIDPRQSVPICVIRGFADTVDCLCMIRNRLHLEHLSFSVYRSRSAGSLCWLVTIDPDFIG